VRFRVPGWIPQFHFQVTQSQIFADRRFQGLEPAFKLQKTILGLNAHGRMPRLTPKSPRQGTQKAPFKLLGNLLEIHSYLKWGLSGFELGGIGFVQSEWSGRSA
jgi:hypothetical protein